jgi:hypothetical protein
MSFFESIPPPLPPAPVRRLAWMRPDGVIPESVPATVVLIRTDQVAVAVGSVRAYPNGFEFTVHSRLRHEDASSWRAPDPFEEDGPGPGPAQPRGGLRLGVMFADGRRGATTGRLMPRDDPRNLVLQREGGGGDNRRWDLDFWVYPLPPDGPVTLVTSWLKYGVAETRAELDGASIRAAAERAVLLWPDDPVEEPGAGWTASSMTAHAPDDPS